MEGLFELSDIADAVVEDRGSKGGIGVTMLKDLYEVFGAPCPARCDDRNTD
jgi:hypothetical protein